MERRADSIQFGEIDGETAELVWVRGSHNRVDRDRWDRV